ncbi:MAG: response regulator [Lachnospiraceae bacterium]|jgi:Response regulators consisting of a CheY-like receiver domain and a winged-helix DNA-binding domain|nr:response regulator [Lachnospiraceae bacterium]MCI9398847.1 response regulator [Lachnospiraceae bacterium]MCX4375711.1 response regulator [Lachnospiraceae bacterium]
MRILIAEDDFASRKVILKFLSEYGECDVTVDGMEAIDAFMMALEDGDPYDLICLDVMMPIMDGYQALKNIRDIEREHNIPEEEMVKIIMTTALNEQKNVKKAFELGCTVYCAKPIDMDKLKNTLEMIGLV